MYLYFRYKNQKVCDVLKTSKEKLTLRIITPQWTKSGHAFLWNLFTLGHGMYKEYQLQRGEKILTTAEVITWIPIFDFMPKRGIHIGPCRTAKDERGKGYYPYLLQEIIKKAPQHEYYMIVEEQNIPSIKGVEKAGFARFAKGIKTRWGRYIITEYLS